MNYCCRLSLFSFQRFFMLRAEELVQAYPQEVLVEVFRTNVSTIAEATLAEQVLSSILPKAIISFDLEDCDKILRIETSQGSLNHKMVIRHLEKINVMAEVLE